MNTRFSLKLLSSVGFSAVILSSAAFAQESRIVVDPSPITSLDLAEPSQDTLMEPVDITEQKVRRERALLDSIIVPKPGSSYFNEGASEDMGMPTPIEGDAATSMPQEQSLSYPTDSVEEYERWAAEQKAKYKKAPRPEPMMPVEVDVEPPPMPMDATTHSEPMPQRPTSYDPEGRLSTSAEMVKQVEEMEVDKPALQPMAAMSDWNAIEGSSIQQVLKGWCDQAGVELIWQSQNDFAVLNPFVMRSTFERAAQKLLDQYQGNQVRPIATLHVNPETAKKTLVVRVVEGQ